MKLLIAFLQLTRSLNLLFIALTQFLFQYCIVLPILDKAGITPVLNQSLFILLVAATVLIAAAGYIINDYFDLNIDQVNKPGKIVVEKLIKRRWTILWHMFFSTAGVLLSFYVSWQLKNFLIVFMNALCVALLLFYSTTFKRKLLIGNIVISLLTAWVVMVLYFAEFNLYSFTNTDAAVNLILSGIFKLSVLYGGFAFIISLIREVVKDIEDMPGDAQYGCRTMPIVWGVHVSKVFAATWLIILIGGVIVMQAYVLQLGWWWPVIYCFFLIVLPLFYIFKKLFSAKTSPQFGLLSKWIKFVMFAGILSMIFWRLYS